MTAGTDVATGVRLAGTELSREIRARVSASAAALTAAGRPPRLTVVVATTDESTAWYVRSIAGAAAKVGIACDVVHLGDDADGEEIEAALRRLSDDPAVHGIILQTPLPPGSASHERRRPSTRARTWTGRTRSASAVSPQAFPPSRRPPHRRSSRCSSTTTSRWPAATRWWSAGRRSWASRLRTCCSTATPP